REPERAAQRAVGDPLDCPAIGRGEEHGREQYQHQSQRHPCNPDHPQSEEGDERNECPDHVNLAMRKIDHADDAVDHRVADGDKGIDRAKRQAVDKLLQEISHGAPNYAGATLTARLHIAKRDGISGSNRLERQEMNFRNLPWFDYAGRFAPLKAAVFTSLFIPAIWTAVSYAMDRLGA